MKSTELKDFHIHCGGFIVLVVLGGASFFWGFRPWFFAGEILSEAQVSVDELKAAEPRLVQENEELRRAISQAVSKQETQYRPRINEHEPILNLMSEMLASRNIELVNLRERDGTSPESIEVDLQTSGDYRDVVHLLNDLRSLRRPNQIKMLNLKSTDDDGQECSMQMTVVFFAMPKLFDEFVNQLASNR